MIIFSISVISTAQAKVYVATEESVTCAQMGVTDCEFVSHPLLATGYNYEPGKSKPGKLVLGDTLIINGDFKLGYDPIFPGCSKFYPDQCYMKALPSGVKVLGKGWDSGCQDPPQLWATEKANTVLNLKGSDNVEIQCLEITDHSDCQEHGPKPCNRTTYPFGNWGTNGLIASDSENVFMKNVTIHGMAYRGAHLGRIKDWYLENVQILNNSFVGWDGDIGAFNSSNSGTITFKNSKIKGSGCGETYPGLKPFNCRSQSQGGYGDGIGTHKTGANWVFINTEISENTSDGLDLLYHDGNGEVTIIDSKFERNAGNQVKINTKANINKTLIDGNCAWFKNNSIAIQNNFDHCRAYGNTVHLGFMAGIQSYLKDSQLLNVIGDVALLSKGSTCDGTEKLSLINTPIELKTSFHGGDPSGLYC